VCATEVVDGRPLRGVVHTPGRLQGGVSGNAACSRRRRLWPSLPDAPQPRRAQTGSASSAARRRAHDRDSTPKVGASGRGLGWTSTPTTRPCAATFRGASYGHYRLTGTRSGSTRRPGPPSSCSPTASTRRQGGHHRPAEQGGQTSSPPRSRPIKALICPGPVVRFGRVDRMQVQIEREIFIRASRSFAVLNDAIRTFQGFLDSQVAFQCAGVLPGPEPAQGRQGPLRQTSRTQEAPRTDPDLCRQGLREVALGRPHPEQDRRPGGRPKRSASSW